MFCPDWLWMAAVAQRLSTATRQLFETRQRNWSPTGDQTSLPWSVVVGRGPEGTTSLDIFGTGGYYLTEYSRTPYTASRHRILTVYRLFSKCDWQFQGLNYLGNDLLCKFLLFKLKVTKASCTNVGFLASTSKDLPPLFYILVIAPNTFLFLLPVLLMY